MAIDIFEKIYNRMGPLGQYADKVHGYFLFPKLEGELNNKMMFRGKEVLQWSINNYLGLGNHPEVRKVDAQAAKDWGMAYPMGARMMSGDSRYHDQLEKELAKFESKEDAVLLNFGYQGMLSAIDILVDRNDVIIYDAESHACIIDGVRLHQGKRFVYIHNDMESLEIQLKRASKLVVDKEGGILVITEGVFGMSGNQGNLKDIVVLKEKYDFRLFVDDAHGFGTMGDTGAGTGELQEVQDGIDIYFGTFAKAMASIGGFIACKSQIAKFIRYNIRSQMFAKSLPMPIVIGALKRLELIRTEPQLREKLWVIVNALQAGLKEKGFNLGTTSTQVTPIVLNGTLEEASLLTQDLRENYNLFCSIVSFPVVPRGTIILRIIPTAMHTLEDVEYTIEVFGKVVGKLKNGGYKGDLAAVEVDEKA